MQASPRSSSFIFVLDRSYQCTQDANTSEFRHLPFEGVYIYMHCNLCIYIYTIFYNYLHMFAEILHITLPKLWGPLPTSPFCPSHWPTAAGNFTGGHHRLQELIVLAWHRKSNWKSMQNFQKSEKGREIFQTPFLRSCFETCRYFEATPLKKLLPTIQNHKAPTPRVDIATKKRGRPSLQTPSDKNGPVEIQRATAFMSKSPPMVLLLHTSIMIQILRNNIDVFLWFFDWRKHR